MSIVKASLILAASSILNVFSKLPKISACMRLCGRLLICAEWEFGGFPAWLLTKKMRLRTDDPAYLAAIDRYYTALMPHLVDHQVTHGGNVIMMQVENSTVLMVRIRITWRRLRN